MNKTLEDIWIMTEEGQIIFDRIFNKNINPEIFAGFISGLNFLTLQIEKDKPSKFKIKNRKFIIIKKKNLFFISNYSRRIKIKMVKIELNSVIKSFFKIYTSEVLSLFNGNNDIFEIYAKEFLKKINRSLNKFNEFWKGLK